MRKNGEGLKVVYYCSQVSLQEPLQDVVHLWLKGVT